MQKKILAVIPARGGSKGVLRKNIRDFNGKPLIVYAIECAKKSGLVDRIIVSTEDHETATVAKECGAEVPFLRPPELATDTAKVADAIVDLLEKLKAREGYEPTHLLLLQTTSPLREASDIIRAVELFDRRDADSLVSVCRTENLLMTKSEDDRLTILNPDLLSTGNRQQLPKYYKPDGCMIYLIKTSVFLEKRSFVAGKLIGYEIERWRSIDIDDPQDFVLGELVQKHQGEIKDQIRNFH